MQKVDAPSKRLQLLTLVVIVAVTATIFGCRGQKTSEPVQTPPAAAATASTAPATQTRSKQDAMAALMALPELKAWSSQIEKSSGGKVHGAVIEYDPKPKLVDGKRYFQLAFTENHDDMIVTWESFLVSESGDKVLVEDPATDKNMTLAQWRKEKNPIARTRPE
jgi:predicted small lipoprotein YifL